jgi:hypothetical protein
MRIQTYISIFVACLQASWLGPSLLVIIWLFTEEGAFRFDGLLAIWGLGFLVGMLVSTLHSWLVLPLLLRLSRDAIAASDESRGDLFTRWLLGHQALVLIPILLLIYGLWNGRWDDGMLPFLIAAQGQAGLVLWRWVRRIKAETV